MRQRGGQSSFGRKEVPPPPIKAEPSSSQMTMSCAFSIYGLLMCLFGGLGAKSAQRAGARPGPRRWVLFNVAFVGNKKWRKKKKKLKEARGIWYEVRKRHTNTLPVDYTSC